MKHYLIFWKTWLESEFDTPWDFVFVEQSNDFRLRSDPNIRMPTDVVNDIFMSFDNQRIDNLIAEYIDAYILSAVIAGNDNNEAYNEVLKYFLDAEFITCVEIPEAFVEQVRIEIKK